VSAGLPVSRPAGWWAQAVISASLKLSSMGRCCRIVRVRLISTAVARTALQIQLVLHPGQLLAQALVLQRQPGHPLLQAVDLAIGPRDLRAQFGFQVIGLLLVELLLLQDLVIALQQVLVAAGQRLMLPHGRLHSEVPGHRLAARSLAQGAAPVHPAWQRRRSLASAAHSRTLPSRPAAPRAPRSGTRRAPRLMALKLRRAQLQVNDAPVRSASCSLFSAARGGEAEEG
jgi:hypothetical protein